MSHEHLHPPTSYSQFTAIRSVSPKRISQHKINHPFRPTGMLSSVDHMFHSHRRCCDGSGQSTTPKMNQNNSFQLPLRTCPDRSMFISFIQIPGLRCMLSVSAHSQLTLSRLPIVVPPSSGGVLFYAAHTAVAVFSCW